MPTRTLKVERTQAGDDRFFVVTRQSDGSTLVDSKPFSRLTAKQKRMTRRKRT